MKTKGFFLELKTGKYHEISDHCYDVILNPQRYGLKTSELEKIAGKNCVKYNPRSCETDSIRMSLLGEILKQGWVRLRGNGSYGWTVHYLNEKVKKDVLKHCINEFLPEYCGDYTIVRLYNHTTNKYAEYTFKDLCELHL